MAEPYPGFLSGDIDAWVQEHRRKNEGLFELIEQLTQDCYRVLAGLEIHKDSHQEILTSALFTRSIELFQASIVVLERGMASAGQVVLRAQLEALFTLAALAKDEATVSHYIDNDKRLRLAIARKLRDSSSPELKPLKGQYLENLHKDLQEAVEDQGITRLSVEELAKIGGFHDWYVTLYASFSSPAHSDARAMERYVETGPQGDIQALTISVSMDETRALLAHAVLFLLKTREVLPWVFEAPIDENHKEREEYVLAVLNDPRYGSSK